ncbi:hypothetical protein [Parabacteroides sp. FAFU027]|uniref:hypothetical protein n=1 Tax=Parabacteroides sp. FAFU027 TaxID=2922715 RepID=UPI001FAEAFCC|nr:hypothetical protein [Parabacteroides sp. FAFU027]
MEQKLEYINQGRGGYVIYKDSVSEIKLFFEFGGGECIAIIHIPLANEWTAKTQRALSERLSILEFIAEQCIKDQAPNCIYKLYDDCIEIISNQK